MLDHRNVVTLAYSPKRGFRAAVAWRETRPDLFVVAAVAKAKQGWTEDLLAGPQAPEPSSKGFLS